MGGEPKKGLLCHYNQGFSELFEDVKILTSWPNRCFRPATGLPAGPRTVTGKKFRRRKEIFAFFPECAILP